MAEEEDSGLPWKRDLSSSPPLVTMVKSTNFGNLYHGAQSRELRRLRFRCICAERHAGSHMELILKIRSQGAAQKCFDKRDDMVETLPAYGPNQTLHVRTLPA
ncbi:MAG: hypothetical protein DMG23_06195 [Acidobacteria bacterium]|nr:MAG: hypothetical protein DMG23_06195 [Acidobacteriota bacterium]